MDHQPLESTHIAAVGYDPALRQLEIAFLRGGTYLYEDVSPEEHHALTTAYSPGAVFRETIRPKGGRLITAPGT